MIYFHITLVDFLQLLHWIPNKVFGHAEKQRVQEKFETMPVEDLEYACDFGEGISRSCPNKQGLKSIDVNF